MLLLCPACQTGNTPKARFCTKCGAGLSAASAAGGETAAGVPTAAPLPSPEPVAVAETSSAPTVVLPRAIGSVPAPAAPAAAAPVAAAPVIAPRVVPPAAVTTPPQPSVVRPRPEPERSSALGDLADDTSPLTIAFNFNHVFVTGHPTAAGVRFENTCAHPLEAVELVLNSSGLGSPVIVRLGRIAPGQNIPRLFEIEPTRTGNMVLSCGLRFQAGAEVSNYRGERTFRVLREPSQQNISIVVQDILNNSGTNAGLGAETGQVEISNLIGEGVIKDLNSLLEHKFEDRFVPLPLELDFSLSMRNVPTGGSKLRIPPPLLGCVQPATCLKLSPVSADGRIRELRLVARDRFVLGRSREEANFLTWFWPRSDKHDEATRHIGKAHVSATVRDGKIVLADNGSVNGSRVDGQPLAKDRGLPFTERAVLRIGTDYEIDVWHDRGAPHGPPHVTNAIRWGGPAAGAVSPLPGSVRFTPRNSELALWDAVWLFTDAAFGRSKSNPVVLDLPGLAEIQGRFHHWRGCFWLEVAHSDGRVALNGQALTVGDIAPLVTGQQVQLGDVAFRVEALA